MTLPIIGNDKSILRSHSEHSKHPERIGLKIKTQNKNNHKEDKNNSNVYQIVLPTILTKLASSSKKEQ